jgi:uncharacterized peroxidase-related enzyme
LVEAHVGLETAFLVCEKALSRKFKEELLLILAVGRQDRYAATSRSMVLRFLGLPESRTAQLSADFRRAGYSPAETALIEYGLKLSQYPPGVGSEDVEKLRQAGFDDSAILETALVTALSSFLCALSSALGPAADSELLVIGSMTLTPPAAALQGTHRHSAYSQSSGAPYIRTVYQSPTSFAPFARFLKGQGFIPNFFRAQTLRPDLVEAEADSISKILFSEGVLTRVQKECIFLAVSAARLNSYCVAAHCNLLRGLGMSPEEGDQVAVDHHQANISEADKALVDVAIKLAMPPSEFSSEDVDGLRK